ncbi:Inosine-5'-monophosphate dehydrogenase [Candidatus Rhabdochlamydia oedothoracis]|uniref:GMP reductase n=1 Tax=Candidatus Rhabdochlamydia oedothoracis TaxID=2720720 RepID=A0ABX8V616_9BACT|nr:MULTISPECIES: guanosine monophosphate reductase [Rhabdochlamydia]KAG6559925.1 Inosine-5'-monophosphate dehydrogenase [Candidatus Rhabdochlamydia sp. W815]QYF48905.1 Inosine-5'-monophosphate dehydrogenase [Candidatus Rhabdochlamydia oedothoracis]
MSIKNAYTFDDIALVPQFNNVPSRTEPSLETWLTKKLKMSQPILCSNMDTTIGEDLAPILLQEGSIPIFHRFVSFKIQKEWVEKYTDKIFISCGIQNIDQTRQLLDLGAAGVCIDVAHGHSDRMFYFIQELKRTHPDKEVIAGNVCTAMAYHDLVNAGADAVKVGVGPGAACTTRMVTGFGVPQFTAIYDCAKIAEKLRVPLIADGGIRNSRDLVLALAAGASTVMVGKLFAMTEESAAPKRDSSNGREAKFRGQASADFQTDFYGGLKDKTVAEGIDFWGPVSGSAKELIDSLLGGLRSGLTYGGARNIKELQRKAEFVVVTANYLGESCPRPIWFS